MFGLCAETLPKPPPPPLPVDLTAQAKDKPVPQQGPSKTSTPRSQTPNLISLGTPQQASSLSTDVTIGRPPITAAHIFWGSPIDLPCLKVLPSHIFGQIWGQFWDELQKITYLPVISSIGWLSLPSTPCSCWIATCHKQAGCAYCSWNEPSLQCRIPVDTITAGPETNASDHWQTIFFCSFPIRTAVSGERKHSS